MTYAPQPLRDLAAYWTKHGGVNLGIVGDTRHQRKGRCSACDREMRLVRRGMCKTCLRRAPRIRPKFEDERDRFLSHVDRTQGECWMWTGAGKGNGYGIVYHERRVVSTHRVAYELFVGPIPDGLVIDHLCHTEDGDCPGGHACLHRRCVNPAHLQAVTNSQNLRRGKGFIGRQSRQTHCRRGNHPLKGDNLIEHRGHRQCRACVRERKAA